MLDDPVLQKLAKKYNVTVPNICLTWAIQRGTSVVAKSSSPQHQQENLAIYEDIQEEKLKLVLTDDDMKEIASLDRGYRYFRPEEWWPHMEMAVFD